MSNRLDFQQYFEFAPIILEGGIVSDAPGGMLSIQTLTEQLAAGLFGPIAGSDPNQFFARYRPLPGASIIDQDLGRYPFANRIVAANAVIVNPLHISYLMVCPVSKSRPWSVKAAIMQALQSALSNHNITGGTYILATPSIYYDTAVMRRMADASVAESNQPQNAWQIDFEVPLLTLAEAQAAQNTLMGAMSNGTQIDSQNGQLGWSGIQNQSGTTQSLAGPGLFPSAASSGAGSVSGGGGNIFGQS